MCGIAGFLATHTAEEGEQIVRRMAAQLSHRGPDDEDAWVDAPAGVALAHRRLSILDLSPAGRQPMHSATGRLVIVFNGEIYNWREVRAELERSALAPQWRGHSDTEVLLAACEVWGVEAAIKKCVGMFAFALWDRQERTLTLARDRMGEKPLYYGKAGGAIVFASELKALHRYPGFTAEVDRGALALYLRHNCIPAPHSIFAGIFKLPPGSMLTLRGDDWKSGDLPQPVSYWSVREAAERGERNPFEGTAEEAVAELERLLRDSVAAQMVADVPLGAFLSGGIDSSTVVALMQQQSSRSVSTFTIGFREQGYNEAEHAAAVARHLGTDHTELYVTPGEAIAVIPRLAELYDEPFADSSQIPTYLVSRLARQHVTVSLSGDGGDELFGGYNRHYWAARLWQKWGGVPRPLRAACASLLRALPPSTWDRVYSGVSRWLPKSLHYNTPGDKLHKLAEVLPVSCPEDIYLNLVSHWKDPTAAVIAALEPLTAVTNREAWASLRDFESRMMFLDSVTYLPDDILTKVDRASMGVSLEARVPLLDHRVVEFSWRLPLSMKIRAGQGKWILRQLLYRHVPREIVERPKAGFGMPIGDWLRGPLRDWAETLLDERRLTAEGFIRPQPVRALWSDHLAGRSNWAYHLWDVLMFQSWLERERSRG
jgi:asparagine synthase (glutamine-hydrolysing)